MQKLNGSRKSHNQYQLHEKTALFPLRVVDGVVAQIRELFGSSVI